MIRDVVKGYLEQLLAECGVKKVYTDARDANIAKPAEWAIVTFPDADKYETRRERIGYEDTEDERIYHYKVFEVTVEAKVSVTSAAKERAVALITTLIFKLQRYLKDEHGYDIELSLGEDSYNPEDNEVAVKNEVSVKVIGVGGVFQTKRARLIKSVILEGEIIEGGYHGES